MGPIGYIVYLFPVLTAAALLYCFAWYWQATRPPVTKKIVREGPKRFSFAGTLHPMERKDALPLLVITAVYALTAFFNLGSMKAPQSALDFGNGESRTFTLAQDAYVTKLWYFPNLGTGSYNLEISSDGEHWSTLWLGTDENGVYYWADAEGYAPSYAMDQNYNQLFKWVEIKPFNAQYVRYVRITGWADKDLLELGELAFFDQDGARIPLDPEQCVLTQGDASGASINPLVDEQDTIPDRLSFTNSTYFDEIYHPRTALEHIEGVYPYEISHPPLGKLILGLGIRMFGMTPFGWRFMGVLFGVLMLPLLYLFVKNLFGKTVVAACGTALLAADFMHLTQTRLATIDTYGVFFILLMYYWMYRYLALPAGTPFGKCALPLALSGLAWGLGAASKWTVIYGCIGLAALYFIGLYQKLRDWPGETRQQRTAWCVKILALSVLCFAVLPCVIYFLSYYPYAQAKGDTSLSAWFKVMWENQTYMFSYHKGVTDTHPYSSRWYQWLLDIRPILYYLDTPAEGQTIRFAAFVNPVVCWGGLLALLALAVRIVFRRCGKALFLFVGYLSQLLPWLLIGRITFAYHYFPSILFLVLALCYVFHEMIEAAPAASWKPAVYGVTGGAVVLYSMFYPVLVGLQVPTWYTTCFLRWFPSWPL